MAISSVVSNYELLVKPIIQREFDALQAGRIVIQGYFLSITNLNSTDEVTLRLRFDARPELSRSEVLAFFDVNGTNQQVTAQPGPSLTYEVSIRQGDTGLFLLQPNITRPNFISNPDFEVRGYVTASLAPSSRGSSYDLLFTPQQRGTFLPRDFQTTGSTPGDFDQIAFGLPTATGGALVTLASGSSANRAPNSAATPVTA